MARAPGKPRSDSERPKIKAQKGRPPRSQTEVDRKAIAELLYRETAMTADQIAGPLGIPHTTAKNWFQSFPELPHRRKGSGYRPVDRVSALEATNEALRAENDRLTLRLQAAEVDPVSTDNLILTAKREMLTSLTAPHARLGEIAQSLRSLVAVRVEEARESTPEATQAMLERIRETIEARIHEINRPPDRPCDVGEQPAAEASA